MKKPMKMKKAATKMAKKSPAKIGGMGRTEAQKKAKKLSGRLKKLFPKSMTDPKLDSAVNKLLTEIEKLPGSGKPNPFTKMKKAPTKFNAKLKAASKAGKLSGKFKAAVDAAPAKMKKMKASAATMKKAAMKLKKESAMKLKKSMAMMKKSMATMKKASAMKMKMKKSAAKMGHKSAAKMGHKK